MTVFEMESNASQDANYRDHLDRNWRNGNTQFDYLQDQINSYDGEINDLQSRVSTLEQENIKREQEIIGLRNEITQVQKFVQDELDAQRKEYLAKFDAQQKEIDKINQAVFGYGEFEINYDQPPANNKPDYEVNRGFQKRVPASHELNYSTVNGKHRFIEIDTEHDHSLQKDQSLKGEKI